MLNIALPKGRLGEKVYSVFEAAGFECPCIHENSRKLIFENAEKGVRYFWVKPSDVAIYVERGAADIGVAGKDILLEYSPDIYELLDLKLGKCRMAVAAPVDFRDTLDRTLRVATKFPNIATEYYDSCGRDIDIIKLNGSIEIAPILHSFKQSVLLFLGKIRDFNGRTKSNLPVIYHLQNFGNKLGQADKSEDLIFTFSDFFGKFITRSSKL